VKQATQGKETFTMYCYANIGVPKNPANPFYVNTNRDSNPQGCNKLGSDFIDYGLGANPNPAPDGTRFMDVKPGDVPQFDGMFKATSLRNTDQRPSPGFVRSYMHNGVFKSLEEVVHFYNKRNVATNSLGQEKAFDWSVGPPAGYTPIFPPPESMEFPANVQNITGIDARRIHRAASASRRRRHRRRQRTGGQSSVDPAGRNRPRQFSQNPHRRLHPSKSRAT
jgi:cytochrome c peroxidase